MYDVHTVDYMICNRFVLDCLFMAGMYKNQLQELAQRSCFNLPSYACIREGPDHAPRFKASVNFNGEIFEGPSYCTTLRQAEHAAAEVALNTLSTRGPSRSLAAKVLDETGVYKNLLQEAAHRAGLKLPVYTTVRSGPGHVPVFTCTVELADMSFTGEPAKTKKQAEKNAAMSAWSALKQMPNFGSSSLLTRKRSDNGEEQEQVRRRMKKKEQEQRDQTQARRRELLSYRDSTPSSSSSHNLLQYQKWMFIGPVSDFSLTCPAQQQKQRKNCFLALLPPSIPLTSSKMLPPTPTPTRETHPSLYSSNRSTVVQVKSRTQVKLQEVPPPVEKHQKDEEKWLGGKPDVTEKIIEKDPGSAKSNCGFGPEVIDYNKPFALPRSGKLNTSSTDHTRQQTQITTSHFGPLSLPLAPAPVGRVAPAVPRILHTGRFHAQNIAPAVHIRSVIPVCAAPPMRPPSSTPTTPQMEEASKQASAPVSTITEQEVSSASAKFKDLKL
ncbi:PREDICTED: double-stranded RNA-binding protein 3-like [Nelumbo nucifera]|uniref:Double-stranded RNA-binding protein 3-like n=2 Tax=Nelumbo nucifera TaxID=4432 RepID=A0A1U7ZCX4_NELNU|nr:PREDICTED: double-stranded RNA-binding protein 3-like [Nelumbo nucifera]DAD34153.1 TPA_asm: hypothetical protein HUJ06_004793 [Nelumbo nucifera]